MEFHFNGIGGVPIFVLKPVEVVEKSVISITIKQNPLTIRSKGSELRSPLGKVGIPIDFSYYAGGPVLFEFLKFCLCCPNEGYSKTQFSTWIGTFFKVCTIFCEIAANQQKTRRLPKMICLRKFILTVSRVSREL